MLVVTRKSDVGVTVEKIMDANKTESGQVAMQKPKKRLELKKLIESVGFVKVEGFCNIYTGVHPVSKVRFFLARNKNEFKYSGSFDTKLRLSYNDDMIETVKKWLEKIYEKEEKIKRDEGEDFDYDEKINLTEGRKMYSIFNDKIYVIEDGDDMTTVIIKKGNGEERKITVGVNYVFVLAMLLEAKDVESAENKIMTFSAMI